MEAHQKVYQIEELERTFQKENKLLENQLQIFGQQLMMVMNTIAQMKENPQTKLLEVLSRELIEELRFLKGQANEGVAIEFE